MTIVRKTSHRCAQPYAGSTSRSVGDSIRNTSSPPYTSSTSCRYIAKELKALLPSEVADPAACAALADCETEAELLRAAAELEAPCYARLPRFDADATALTQALATVTQAAPFLGVCSVECVMPLRLRGRVRGRRIWVGLPCEELGLGVEHAAFQAAHEATVAELVDACRTRNVAPHRRNHRQSAGSDKPAVLRPTNSC